jgi:ubiquinone/menaquinone biosynthesis C-methylase UbiE
MSFFENTRKPVGLGGKIMVVMMNLGHSPVARWGLRFLELAPDVKVLDCGCGGGANIKRLLKKCPQGIVKGIDYSLVSVEKSKKVNETAIVEGRCTVLQGSVADMIFADNWFNEVTAFETVYFWSDLPRCLREVRRVLKPGGTFLICNESNGDTDKDEKWTEIIGGMTIYKDIELKAYLEQAGFHDEVLRYIYEYGYTAEQIASAMSTDINLVALNVAHLATLGYNLHALEHKSNFLK